MRAARPSPTSFSSDLVAAAIGFYQRRLSPLKGFSCAYRVRHGGESCSQHIKGLVTELGPLAAVVPARERLGACREANEALRRAAVLRSWETGSRRGRRRRWFHRWWRRGDRAEDLFDSGDESGPAGDGESSGCEPDSLECDFCDCGP